MIVLEYYNQNLSIINIADKNCMNKPISLNEIYIYCQRPDSYNKLSGLMIYFDHNDNFYSIKNKFIGMLKIFKKSSNLHLFFSQ